MIKRVWRHFHHDPVQPVEPVEPVTDHPALKAMLRTGRRIDYLSRLLDLDAETDGRPSGVVARDMITGTYEGDQPR